jgi:hypothetical protein
MVLIRLGAGQNNPSPLNLILKPYRLRVGQQPFKLSVGVQFSVGLLSQVQRKQLLQTNCYSQTVKLTRTVFDSFSGVKFSQGAGISVTSSSMTSREAKDRHN